MSRAEGAVPRSPDPAAYLSKAATILREGGPLQLVLRTFQKLASPLVEFGNITFVMRDLNESLPEPRAALDLELRRASLADFESLLELSHAAQSERALRERFRHGDLCFVAVDPVHRIVHSRWVLIGRGHVPELGMDLILRPDEAYFYDGFTRPDMRGRGIDGVLRHFIFSSLHAAGFNTAYSYVRGDNPVASRAARRWQKPAGRFWYLRLRGSSPLVIGKRTSSTPALEKRAPMRGENGTRSLRARAWREWFEGWVSQPFSKRSIGCHSISEEAFASTAEFVVAALRLDPDSDVVLDVGCDSAMVSRLVAPRCRYFVGVDFIPAMLADIPQPAFASASGRPASLVAADGRFAPFRAHAFTKAYCSGVIHTVPSREDGLEIIQELLRVCRPGGEVLVAAVPDTAKRFRACTEAWRQAGPSGKLRLLISLALPRPVKNGLRRLLGLQGERLVFLDYDLDDLKRKLESQGARCEILHFPDNYWSANFRNTRSNLLIRKAAAS